MNRGSRAGDLAHCCGAAIGLTGGIGAGKSTVSATFSECGGIIVDGDVIAREVVEPGTEGLADAGRGVRRRHPASRRRAEPAGAGREGVPRRREARRRSTASCIRWWRKRRAEIIAAVPEDAVIVEDIPLLVESADGAAVPAGRDRARRRRDPGRRLIEQRGMQRSRRPRPDRRAGHRGAAPRGRRRLAGQLGQRRRTGRSRPRDAVAPADRCRSRTTSQHARDRPRASPVGAGRPDVARPGAPHRRPAEDRLRAPGVARRPHRLDRRAGLGRQGRHRRSGHRRIPRRRRRTRRALLAAGYPRIEASPRTSPRPMPAAPSPLRPR